jgi:RNA polymerase sigma-70 factor (ECF subfamily)
VDSGPGESATPLLDFAGVYRTHARDVRRFALFLSGDPALADDLVSEAFVRLWIASERVDLTTVRAYLFAIVRNLFLKDANRARRYVPLEADAIDRRPGPEDTARTQDELRAVLQALAELPEVDRAAVLMRADEGLPYEDIAAALSISVAAARVKVHRARLRLAEVRHSAAEATRTREQRHDHDS